MAFAKDEKTKQSFFKIRDGQFFVAAKDKDGKPITEPKNGEVAVQNPKDGTIKYYDTFSKFTGVLRDIKVVEPKDPQYSLQWHFIFTDAGKQFVLTINYDNLLAQDILNRLAQIAVSEGSIGELTLTAGKDKTKTYNRIYVRTRKQEVKDWRYSLAEQPIVKVIKRHRGKDERDDAERLRFWENVLEKEILPALSAPLGQNGHSDLAGRELPEPANTSTGSVIKKEAKSPVIHDEPPVYEDEDGLPF